MKKIFQLTNGQPYISNADFEAEIGKETIAILRTRHLQQLGGMYCLDAGNKIMVIGDLHEQVDILLDIFAHIQHNPQTNLDFNPHNKLILLGDIVSPTKSILSPDTDLGLDNASPNWYRNDPIIRATSWLIAHYPNQFFIINGNHDIGFALSVELSKNPLLQYHPILFQEMLSSHYLGASPATLYEHMTLRATLSPMLIKIISPRQETYMFMHSPGNIEMPGMPEILASSDWMHWIRPHTDNKLFNIFMGHGNISKEPMLQTCNKLSANYLCFGHAAPEGLLSALATQRLIKTDSHPGAIGFNTGNSCYVDSQTRTIHSGYIILDTMTHTHTAVDMTQVNTRHPCSDLALQAAQIPHSESWKTQWMTTLKHIC